MAILPCCGMRNAEALDRPLLSKYHILLLVPGIGVKRKLATTRVKVVRIQAVNWLTGTEDPLLKRSSDKISLISYLIPRFLCERSGQPQRSSHKRSLIKILEEFPC